MILLIILLLVGLLILGAGVYYLIIEKDDKESVKIYSAVSIIGFLIAAVSVVVLVMM